MKKHPIVSPFVTALFLANVAIWSSCNTPTSSSPAVTTDERPLIFVGTYTQKLGHVDGKATGIYTCRLDTATGTLQIVQTAADIDNPSFVALSPNKKILYAVGENGGKPEQPFGSVAAYRVEPDGKLLKINELPSYGVAPCHVSTDATGRFVFVANYVTGNVLSYGTRPDGGLTDTLAMRQHPGAHPWAHQVRTSPDNRLLWAVDKGADQVFTYDLGADGRLRPAGSLTLEAESGPRHLDFCPADRSLVAVINELSCTILTFRRDSAGRFGSLAPAVSTLPADFSGANTCADLHFHPNGRFLYGSNRGHNSIAVFAVAPATGQLAPIEHVPTGGEVPRNFLITADGKWLLVANQNSSTVTAFRIDAATGRLTPTSTPSPIPTPVCLVAG
jgi:6-phosphogluconolactonase